MTINNKKYIFVAGKDASKNDTVIVYCNSKDTNNKCTTGTADSEDGKTLTITTLGTIITNMLFTSDEVITDSHLYAELTNDNKLKLYYQHHVTANNPATTLTGYVSWTFTY